MLQLFLRPLAWFLIASLLFPAQAGLVSQLPDSHPSSASEPNVETPVWTVWGADQYALGDDSTSIWIGAVGGVVRWDKQAGTYRRYSRLDGLPHTKVLAVVVDAAGNRWFGGDGGLSRLDAAEAWTHFQSSNSSLHSDHVDGIAVVDGDTLYVSHGLPDGSVDRRDADGSWRWYPNREAAIQADYATIVQKRDSNALWTVAGSEIWSGSSVFDGQGWVERQPPAASGGLTSLVVDSHNRVWALSTGLSVFEWDGMGWLEHPVPVSFTGALNTLTVDQEDRVWVGMQERGTIPYTNESASIKEVTGANSHHLGVAAPVVALLSTSEGLWAIGPGWVMDSTFTVTELTDAPRFGGVSDAMAGRDGSLWLHSWTNAPPYEGEGVVQTLDDKGTLGLEDDVWQLPSAGSCDGYVRAFERSGGDVWYSSACVGRAWSDQKAVRYHLGQRTEYRFPEQDYSAASDIFAEDERHVWFVASRYESTRISGAVLRLDDGGTPTELVDDTWVAIPIASVSGKLSVAVDAKGRLWHGQASGLYHYDGSAWRQEYSHAAVCDLVPASDGTLFAQVEMHSGAGCGGHSDQVVVVLPDGTVDPYPTTVSLLVSEETVTVRTASRRNNLWTIAGDGAIWFVDSRYGLPLRSQSSSALEGYPLPVSPESVYRLEVDRRGHVWIVSGGKLWRMEGPKPNFVNLFLPLIER